MATTTNIPTCENINGVSINEVQFNIDGTVVGLIGISEPPTETNLSYDCCTANGWTFDPTNTKCYWADTCINGGDYNIVLDPVGNTGAYFQVDEDEEDYCSLELKFKFLLRVDCQKLIGTLKSFLENIHLEVSIEKVIYDETLPIPNNLEEVARVDLFNIGGTSTRTTDTSNIVAFLDGNTNTGILLNDISSSPSSQLPPTGSNCDEYTPTGINLDGYVEWEWSGGYQKDPTVVPSVECCTQYGFDIDPSNIYISGGRCVESTTTSRSFINGAKKTDTTPPKTCEQITNQFLADLTIENPSILQTIFNERLKVSIIGNTLTNFAILLDRVELNKVCKIPLPPPFFDIDCPSFDLKRIIDNKKSWVENLSTTTRIFDLERRITNYSINHEKLSINTKEIDLALNPAQAIENDVIIKIVGNECLLAPATGCTSGDTHDCVDLRPLITTEIVDNDDLLNMLIDVKNRKTLSAYPTLALMYYRYLNSVDHCGVTPNGLDVESVSDFADLIGYYWSDLIEQVVPATTIWGSSVTSNDGSAGSGSIFGSNKFVYRKGTTFFCTGAPNYPVPSPVRVDEELSVFIQDITNINTTPPSGCDEYTPTGVFIGIYMSFDWSGGYQKDPTVVPSVECCTQYGFISGPTVDANTIRCIDGTKKIGNCDDYRATGIYIGDYMTFEFRGGTIKNPTVVPSVECCYKYGLVEEISNGNIHCVDVIPDKPPTGGKCTTVSIRQQNYGSEFLGTIVSNIDPTATGSTISITETIQEECDLFEEC